MQRNTDREVTEVTEIPKPYLESLDRMRLSRSNVLRTATSSRKFSIERKTNEVF